MLLGRVRFFRFVFVNIILSLFSYAAENPVRLFLVGTCQSVA